LCCYFFQIGGGRRTAAAGGLGTGWTEAIGAKFGQTGLALIVTPSGAAPDALSGKLPATAANEPVPHLDEAVGD
jgi:hypothetical protein